MAFSRLETWATARRRQPPWRPRRVAIVGVGHALRGDDAAGLAVAQRAGRLSGERLLVLEGGPAPENVTGILRRFEPDLVLLVDAADLGAAPGTVRWLGPDDVEGLSATTHTMPLSILAHYLEQEMGCRVYFIGIQPGQNGIGEPLSEAVERAVQAVEDGLRAVFA